LLVWGRTKEKKRIPSGTPAGEALHHCAYAAWIDINNREITKKGGWERKNGLE
jgi:hypothetical protein